MIRSRIFRESQSVSPKIFINYNVKNSSFPVGKPGSHHPHQVTQVKSPITRHVPPDMMSLGGQRVISVAQNISPQSNHEEIKDIQIQGQPIKHLLVLFESVQVMKEKERLRNCSRLEETKED